MQEHEIHTGKDYIVKVGHNQVKVRVLSYSGHSWVVKTAGGKFMPVNNAERFIRLVVPAGNVPLQAPEAPTEADQPEVHPETLPNENTETPPPQSEVPSEPATTPASDAPVSTAPEKKLTMLDAAAKVLEIAGHPMTIKDILTAMEESGLWKPGKGLTPGNSLISAIGTEQRRKPNPRFRKTAPGTFEFAKQE